MNIISIKRNFIAPNDSFFLFGPRGTGKSFFLEHEFMKHKLRFDLLNEDLILELSSEPASFYRRLEKLSRGSWVVLDEVQRLPMLLNYVHKAIEELKLKFVLCGSSTRKLRRKGVNLLGGRAYEKRLYLFLAKELADKFNLERVLEIGSLPLVYFSDSSEERLKA